MWKAVALNFASGAWEELSSAPKLESLAIAHESENIFRLWVGEFPKTEEAQIRLFNEVNAANDGRVVSLSLGMDFSRAEKRVDMSSCSGDCFCVIAHGKRECQAKYCNSAGWCWWVKCPGKC